jgi:hypothetical protein
LNDLAVELPDNMAWQKPKQALLSSLSVKIIRVNGANGIASSSLSLSLLEKQHW